MYVIDKRSTGAAHSIRYSIKHIFEDLSSEEEGYLRHLRGRPQQRFDDDLKSQRLERFSGKRIRPLPSSGI